MNESTQRNVFQVGDAVKLPCVPTVFQVVAIKDNDLVSLRAPSGHVVTAGMRTLSRVKTKEQ